jgi:hypothetical protein
MRRSFAILLLIVLTLALFRPAYAQSTVSVTDANVTHEFGAYVNFKARLAASALITDVILLLRAQGEANTRSERIPISPDGLIDYTYTLSQGPLRPFARVDYWFNVTLQGGEQVETAPVSFTYDDNRFPWQTAGDDNLQIHWYAGDAAFAQAALDAAHSGLRRTSEILAVVPGRPLDIYIYTTAADMQTALQIGGQQSVGGHASPDLGIGLVYIAPGPQQGLEMERKIPHELAHILTYELTGERYIRLPVWLREGIASVSELSPNPDYAQAIDKAVEEHSIIPMTEMCSSFPPEMSRIFLAYSEATSFTRFLVSQYGTSGLGALIQAYADGLDCEQGSTRALSRPLSQVESDWRASVLGEDRNAAALQNLFPYLAVLTMMLFVPLVFIFIPTRQPDGKRSSKR